MNVLMCSSFKDRMGSFIFDSSFWQTQELQIAI